MYKNVRVWRLWAPRWPCALHTLHTLLLRHCSRVVARLRHTWATRYSTDNNKVRPIQQPAAYVYNTQAYVRHYHYTDILRAICHSAQLQNALRNFKIAQAKFANFWPKPDPNLTMTRILSKTYRTLAKSRGAFCKLRTHKLHARNKYIGIRPPRLLGSLYIGLTIYTLNSPKNSHQAVHSLFCAKGVCRKSAAMKSLLRK